MATVVLGGARSLLNVPMLNEDELIGAIGIYRTKHRAAKNDKALNMALDLIHGRRFNPSFPPKRDR